ncbi:MAG: hypothetical protein KBT21_08175 [Treponema sp.]|nr:hypothetical protein [Candidatus Treponema merdequi]
MKKIVGTIAAVALIAASAFAEVNVGMGFSRGFFTPIAYNGKDAMVDISTSWGNQPRIGASISAASEDCGVVADIKFDGGAVNVNDNAYIWCKPASWLKFTIGQTFDDTLRGNACFASWDWLRFGNIAGESFIFDRISANPDAGDYAPLVGSIIMLDPIEGLHIAVGIPVVGWNAGKTNADGTPNPGNDNYYADKWENVAKKLQVQAGYTIADVMQIKAQWIGRGEDAKKNLNGTIEAAVSLKAVENMTLDVGAKFRTDKDAPFDINAFWSMGFDAFRVNVLAGVNLPTTSVEAAKVTTITAGAGIAYDFGNGVGLEADVRYQQSFQKDVNTDPSIGFGAYLNKGIANGGVGFGFEGAMKTSIRDFAPNAKDDFIFAVPVRVQCFF